jgi:hypothetical protein
MEVIQLLVALDNGSGSQIPNMTAAVQEMNVFLAIIVQMEQDIKGTPKDYWYIL